ncbi:MAG: hypothetical protein FWH21_03295 [Kiritimatiellaeota bacterium]|nr:hypothetical protein [Kiritimatiellota bacterium]
MEGERPREPQRISKRLTGTFALHTGVLRLTGTFALHTGVLRLTGTFALHLTSINVAFLY